MKRYVPVAILLIYVVIGQHEGLLFLFLVSDSVFYGIRHMRKDNITEVGVVLWLVIAEPRSSHNPH